MTKVKSKIIWLCSSCQTSSMKWAGQCHQCKEWNTLIEQEVASTPREKTSALTGKREKVWRLDEIDSIAPKRLLTGIGEFDRLIGGGIVPGSLLLLAGDPGIGKSTLLLQLSAKVSNQHQQKVLYVSGEESIPQICLRASRLGIKTKDLLLVSETRISAIRAHIEAERPALVIIDSIQIVYKEEIPSAAGSVVQVRECSSEFLHIAKSTGIPIILIGHVTKSGDLAGPRVLEHMVDTVLYFESDIEAGLRLIRGIKNRFGATDELAVFQMGHLGLEEVKNPSALFIKGAHGHSGSSVAPSIEGSRAMLIEVQALVTKSFYPQPARRSTGLDPNRLAVLLAVLEKKVGLSLHTCDVFVSIAGGLRITEPAIDLAVAAAICSSLTSRAIDPKVALMGEIALSGDLRPVSRQSTRLKELSNMGFRSCIGSCSSSQETLPIKIYPAKNLKEALLAAGCLG